MNSPDLLPTVVVLPTYNEIANLQKIVTDILALSPAIRLVIVDDASPDGTGVEAERLAVSLGRLSVIRRKGKLGLGSAYRQAFQSLLQDSDAELICQMDADFSHSPDDLKMALQAVCDGGWDVVVGSRYVPGAKIHNWSRRRRLLSRCGNLYTRMITGIPQTDVTAGMKCWRRKALETIDLNSVRTDGYGFQIEMSWNAWRLGFSSHEVPITFAERAYGTSKMDWPIVWEAILLPWKLRLRSPAAEQRKS